MTFLVGFAVFLRRRLWALSQITGHWQHHVTHSYLRYLMRSWDIFCSNVAFFKFVTIVTLTIIHKEIYPCFATIDQLQNQKFIKILLYPDYLLEQCVETWWFFKCVLIDFGICSKTFFFKKNSPNNEIFAQKEMLFHWRVSQNRQCQHYWEGCYLGQKGVQGCWSNNMRPFLTVLHALPRPPPSLHKIVNLVILEMNWQWLSTLSHVHS